MQTSVSNVYTYIHELWKQWQMKKIPISSNTPWMYSFRREKKRCTIFLLFFLTSHATSVVFSTLKRSLKRHFVKSYHGYLFFPLLILLLLLLLLLQLVYHTWLQQLMHKRPLHITYARASFPRLALRNLWHFKCLPINPILLCNSQSARSVFFNIAFGCLVYIRLHRAPFTFAL